MIGWEHLPLLFGVGLAAGFVDSIAGGGGMITLPVLLSFGLPPQTALATNKLQAVFGSATAAVHYSRAGTVAPRECVAGFLYTFAGAALGTIVVRQMDPSFLRVAIPLLLICVALYMLVHPGTGSEDGPRRMSRGRFDVLFGLGLGFYDGFFGPGTGTFWTMAFMLALGFNMVRATGGAKIMNFSSNLASILFFSTGGHVLLARDCPARPLDSRVQAGRLSRGHHGRPRAQDRHVRRPALAAVAAVSARPDQHTRVVLSRPRQAQRFAAVRRRG